jgi:hypothetical protein
MSLYFYARRFFLYFNRDPHSTPARRRRIIAEVAKSTLRRYCVTACANVHRFRIHTKAALRIQCFWRLYYAKRLVKNLRLIRSTKAAILIQSLWRMKLSKLLRLRLLKLLYQQRAKKLVKTVERLFYERKEREYQRKLRRKRLMKLRQEKEYATIQIQTAFRGYYQRKRYLILLEENKRRRSASIMIQKHWKRYFMRKCYLNCLRRRKEASFLLAIWLLCRLRRVQYQKQRKACITMQSVIRMFIMKKRVTKLKREKYLREKENLLLSSYELILSIQLSKEYYQSFFSHFFSSPSTSPSLSSLQSVVSEKEQIHSFLQFCLSYGILRIIKNHSNFVDKAFQSHQSIFTIGSVIEQVINSYLQSPSMINLKKSLGNDLSERILSLSINKPEKSYIVNKQKTSLTKNQMILKMLNPALSFSSSTASHVYRLPCSTLSSSSANNSKTSVDSRNEMKSSAALVKEKKELYEEVDLLIDDWNYPLSVSSSSGVPAALTTLEIDEDLLKYFPNNWNELKMMNNDYTTEEEVVEKNSSLNENMIFLSKYNNAIELKIITKIKFPLVSRLSKSSKSVKNHLELLKSKEEIRMISIIFENGDPHHHLSVSTTSQHDSSTLDALTTASINVSPFSEISLHLCKSFGDLSSSINPPKSSTSSLSVVRVKLKEKEPIRVPTPEPEIIEVVELEPPLPEIPPPLVVLVTEPEPEPEIEPEREPTPEPSPLPPLPPVIDYDLMARRIQVFPCCLLFLLPSLNFLVPFTRYL